MESPDYLRFVLALAFVLGSMWLLVWLLKRFGFDKKLRGVTGQGGRLAVSEVLYLDPKRKLLIARADAQEYLLLVHGDAVTLIDKLEKKDA